MSDKYYKRTMFECAKCGRQWSTPGAAEICYKEDEIEELLEDVDNHKNLAMSEVIEHLKEVADHGDLDYTHD